MKFFLKIRRFIAILIAECVLLLFLLAFPVVSSIVHNEVYLIYLKEQTKYYSHPPDSQLEQRFSFIDNFAGTGNQCGYIVAEVRKTMLKPYELRKFYNPILAATSSNKNPPYYEVSLFMLNDEKNLEPIQWLSGENYERIARFVKKDTRSYLLITSVTGYPPNFDFRCH